MSCKMPRALAVGVLFFILMCRLEAEIISCTRWYSWRHSAEAVERMSCRSEDGGELLCDETILRLANMSTFRPDTALFQGQFFESSQQLVISHEAHLLREGGAANRARGGDERDGETESVVEWKAMNTLGFCSRGDVGASALSVRVTALAASRRGVPNAMCCEPCSFQMCMDMEKSDRGATKRVGSVRCRLRGFRACCFACKCCDSYRFGGQSLKRVVG